MKSSPLKISESSIESQMRRLANWTAKSNTELIFKIDEGSFLISHTKVKEDRFVFDYCELFFTLNKNLTAFKYKGISILPGKKVLIDSENGFFDILEDTIKFYKMMKSSNI